MSLNVRKEDMPLILSTVLASVDVQVSWVKTQFGYHLLEITSRPP